MLNIGFRPTIHDESHTIEVHIFDFNKEIYNQNIKIEFSERIRGEKKFENLDALKKQLQIDESKCKKIFNLLS
jgi:riboflavin kinase/FMN adenylyltransferase